MVSNLHFQLSIEPPTPIDSTKVHTWPAPCTTSPVVRRKGTEHRPRQSRISLPSHLKQLKYHMYTIWLFNRNDLKTIVVPQTIFGVLHALCATAFGIQTSKTSGEILRRIPIVLVWTWFNLLPFCIGNQRLPDSIKEDAMNKPWRPLPSKRITPEAAKNLHFVAYATALLVSSMLGGVSQTLAILLQCYLHNEFGAADVSALYKNLLNGSGYISYGWGAMRIALDQDDVASVPLAKWYLLIALIITVTVQVQDLRDEEGDAMNGRKTLPLVIGDFACRWTVAILVPLSAVACGIFWNSTAVAYAAPFSLAILVAWRTMTKTAANDDHITFLLYNLWMVSVYTLPLVQQMLS